MCIVQLPPADNPLAVNKYIISYHNISYHIIIISYRIKYETFQFDGHNVEVYRFTPRKTGNIPVTEALAYSSGGRPYTQQRDSACIARAQKWVAWFLNRCSHNHYVEFISKHVTPDWPPLTWPSIGFRQTGSAMCFITNQLRLICRLRTCFSDADIGYALRWEGQHELVKTWQEVAVAYFKTLLNIL